MTAAAMAHAQTTSGDAANGQALYTGNTFNCKGCHGATIVSSFGDAVRNAANAGGQVLYAISQGMTAASLSAAQANDIAAYIGTFVADPGPANFPVPHNSPGVSIFIGTLKLNSVYGDFTAIEVVTPPAKGSVSFSGTTATYIPNAGASGADEFTYRAVRLTAPAGTSSTRRVTLAIEAAPVPVVTSAGFAAGTVGVPFSYAVTATNSPTSFMASGLPAPLVLNAMSGAIGGTPVAAGTFAVTLSAANGFGTGPGRGLTLTIAKGTQTVSFPPQPTPRSFSAGATFPIGPAATSSQGLPITYSSTTPATCSVAGTTVTMLAAGACGLAATQPGSADYNAASATQTVFLASAAPVLVTPALPRGNIGEAYSGSLLVGGSPQPVAASLAGLPTGLSATHDGAGTVTIAGTPTQAGTFTLALEANNGGGFLATNITLVIEDSSHYANAVTAVSAGSHTCVIQSGGVQCWGDNTAGKLGNGTTTRSTVAVTAIPPGGGATQVSAGIYRSCAVVAGGVKCWGGNGGLLGDGGTDDQHVPVNVIAAGSNATQVAVESFHACAVVAGGVRCWGQNYWNQLGDNSGTSRESPVQAIPAGSGVTAVAVGGSNSCAIVSGSVRCWGNDYNASGFVNIADTAGATSLGMGNVHACVAIAGGVKCWGGNYAGQLGDGGVGDGLPPVTAIAPGSGVTAVSVGYDTSCALANGGVRCWGSNYFGAAGAPPRSVIDYYELSPITAVAEGSGASAVSTSGGHTCVVLNGRVQCFGYADNGTLGRDLPAPRSTTPIPALPAASGAVELAAGSQHVCARAGGGVRCWGKNDRGQLGNGSRVTSAVPQTALAAGSGATALAAGSEHSCAVVNGRGRCWGANGTGRLGIGNDTDQLSPVPVFEPVSGVIAMAGGARHGCSLGDGNVRCWGAGESGQLAVPPFPSYVSTARPAAALGGSATAVAAGNDHTCALVDGGVKCWGANGFYQLGSFGPATGDPKVALPSGSGATRVAAGGEYSCAAVDGGLTCWGSLLGAHMVYPTALMPAGSNVAAIAAGSSHLCVLVNGGVQCRGYNMAGQLGNGTVVDSTAFVTAIPAGSNVTAIAAGSGFTCAALNGAVACWGDNSQAQLASPTLLAAPPGVRVWAAIPATTAVQVIGFGTLPPRAPTSPPFTLVAQGGGSGNPVVFASTTPAVCTVSGNQVTLTGATGTCTLTANQAGAAGYAAAPQVTQSFAVSSGPPALLGVDSRKSHGAAGTFDRALDTTATVAGAPTVEARAAEGGVHRLVFRFAAAVTAVAAARVEDPLAQPAGSATLSIAGSEVTVFLSGVADGARVAVLLDGVNGGMAPVAVAVAFLQGDVGGTGRVSAADAAAVRARAGAALAPATMHADVDLSGAIGPADLAMVRSRAGRALP